MFHKHLHTAFIRSNSSLRLLVRRVRLASVLRPRSVVHRQTPRLPSLQQMRREEIHAGRRARPAPRPHAPPSTLREHDRLLAMQIHLDVREQLRQLLGRADLEVFLRVRHAGERNVAASGHVSRGESRARFRHGAVESALGTRVDHREIGFPLLVRIDEIHHLIERADHAVVRIHVEVARRGDRSRCAALQRTLLVLPARKTAIEHIHLRVLVEEAEHPPCARGTEETVRVVAGGEKERRRQTLRSRRCR